MRRILPLAIAALTIVLVAVGSIRGGTTTTAGTPDGAVHAMFAAAKARDWKGALNYINNAKDIREADLARDLGGSVGSLRTYSSLEKVDSSILHQNDREAMVRVKVSYSSAVGAIYDNRDLRVVNNGGAWKVDWPVYKQAQVPPQVIPVNYLRWDVVRRDSDDDWGAQNVDPPKVRIISMNALEKDGNTVILGEIVNEDTVPGFVSVNATLVSKNGDTLGEESAFDKMSHTLLPKEVSPFRIDFPKIKLSDVKNVRMTPSSTLVEASADPVIGVLHQRIEKDSRGNMVLTGELVNQSGEIVNIPHVIATFYDSNGKVIWVADGYVDRALMPQTPERFQVAMRNDLPQNVQYRVVVNTYSASRMGD